MVPPGPARHLRELPGPSSVSPRGLSSRTNVVGKSAGAPLAHVRSSAAPCGTGYRLSLRNRRASGQFRSTEIEGSPSDLVVTNRPSAAMSYEGGRS